MHLMEERKGKEWYQYAQW